jgi:hypothetical protein
VCIENIIRKHPEKNAINSFGGYEALFVDLDKDVKAEREQHYFLEPQSARSH